MKEAVTILMVLTLINTVDLVWKTLRNRNVNNVIKYPSVVLDDTQFEKWIDRKIRDGKEVKRLSDAFDYPSLYFKGSNLDDYIKRETEEQVDELAKAAGYLYVDRTPIPGWEKDEYSSHSSVPEVAPGSEK